MKLHVSSAAIPVLALALMIFPELAPQSDSAEFTTNGGRIRVATVASGLVHPWSIAFTPDGTMLVAEQAGRIRLIRDGALQRQPVWTVPGLGMDVLHGLDVHPQFAQNRLVF